MSQLPPPAVVPPRFRLPRLGSLLAAVLTTAATGAIDLPHFPGVPAGVVADVRAEFGARGDGTGDDTKALQNAIDHVAARGGGTVYIPAGIYLVNTLADHEPNRLPQTETALRGPNGYTHQLTLRSRVRLLGEGGRASILKMPAGSRTDAVDRSARRNRAIVVLGAAGYDAANPGPAIEQIEISRLGFDLDNGVGRRAIQIRSPVRDVRIHACEGFQSDLERGAAPLDGLAYDNHFVNLAATGNPLAAAAPGAPPPLPENITVQHCTVRGLLQLTSDGGAGVRNLWIHGNLVVNALSFGIAVTSTGPLNARFEDIVIEDNTIETPAGAGILVGENYIATDMDLTPIRLHAMRRVTIRRNTIRIASAPSPGVNFGPWAPDAAGIMVAGMLLETSALRIEDNRIAAENRTLQPTSRQALRIIGWDFNWAQDYRRRHGGADAQFPISALDRTNGTVWLPGHGLPAGAPVQLAPLEAATLPAGLEPYRIYRAQRLDADRFALAEQPGGPVIVPAGAAGNGRIAVILTPLVEDLTIARNAVEGTWDWDAMLTGATRRTLLAENTFRSRFNLEGVHEDWSFAGNHSAGTFAVRDATLRRTVFADNTWALDERIAGRNLAPGIFTVAGKSDRWRRIEAAFERNRFEFTPASATENRTMAALWLNATDWIPPTWSAWSGTAALRLAGNRLPATGLRWSLEPNFVATWTDNNGSNTRGALATVATAPVPAVPARPESLPAAPEPNEARAAARLAGFSIRSTAGTGAATLIVGFVTSGSAPAGVLARGTGPGLAEFGIAAPAVDPQLRLYAGATLVASNDNWGTSANAAAVAAAAAGVGAFPYAGGSRDAALLSALPAGAYAIHFADAAATGRTALVEIFRTGAEASSTLAGLSARTQVGTGDNVLIAGFVVQGGASQRLLVRAIGPGLAAFGVSGTLPAPRLELRTRAADGTSVVLGGNQGWAGDAQLAAAFAAAGAFALDPRGADAALLATVPPGNYTVQVSDTGGRTGVALVEVFALP